MFSVVSVHGLGRLFLNAFAVGNNAVALLLPCVFCDLIGTPKVLGDAGWGGRGRRQLKPQDTR